MGRSMYFSQKCPTCYYWAIHSCMCHTILGQNFNVKGQWVNKRWDQVFFKGEVPGNLWYGHIYQWTFLIAGTADCVQDSRVILICLASDIFHHCVFSPLTSDFWIFAYTSQDHIVGGGRGGAGQEGQILLCQILLGSVRQEMYSVPWSLQDKPLFPDINTSIYSSWITVHCCLAPNLHFSSGEDFFFFQLSCMLFSGWT